MQFVDQHFVDSYYPTIENTFTKMVKYKGQDFQLDIIDTAGQVSRRHRPWEDEHTLADASSSPSSRQDEFSILSSRHAVGLHGWILVYSVSSRSSFEMCSIIREKILNYTGRDSVPMVLVGNKSDLAVQRCARSLTRSPEPLSRGSLTPLSVPRSPRAQASDA